MALYGVDLAGLFTGALTPRRALVLAERASHDPRSHLRASMLGGPEHLGWGIGEHLQATLIDAVNTNTVTTARVNGAKKAKPMPPTWRPAQQKKQAKSLAELDVVALAMMTG